MITASELPFYFVIVFAALPAPIGVSAVSYYNVQTFRIVRCIQRKYQLQGEEWPFWTDRGRLIAFVLNPEFFLRETPLLAHEEKVLLVRHRQTMRSYIIRTFVFMFSSFGVAIIFLLIVALIHR